MEVIWLVAACLFSFVSQIASHGAMVYPNTWLQKKEWRKIHGRWRRVWPYMEAGRMCHGGWHIDKNKLCPGGPPGQPRGCGVAFPGVACLWFNDRKLIPNDQCVTIHDKNLRTYDINDPYPSHTFGPFRKRHRNPWRAPGTAPIDSPCGVGGGNLRGCNGKKCPQGAYAYGPKAEEFEFPHTPRTTTWKRGSVQETGWGITANHGGGYAFRLCKVPPEGVRGITEECFKKNYLKFVGDKQWIQWGSNKATRKEIPAIRTSVGTFPEGSQWTKNPVPACRGRGGSGGFSDWRVWCDRGTQFKPPIPGLQGFGSNMRYPKYVMKFTIVDHVRVPTDIPTGKYVLSWRWDCEETNQVWNTCADINIT